MIVSPGPEEYFCEALEAAGSQVAKSCRNRVRVFPYTLTSTALGRAGGLPYYDDAAVDDYADLPPLPRRRSSRGAGRLEGRTCRTETPAAAAAAAATPFSGLQDDGNWTLPRQVGLDLVGYHDPSIKSVTMLYSLRLK